MKILIIEDEIKIATSIKRGLTQENYVVDIANDGIDGYDMASENMYDLIILDLMLPAMDGLTICKKLRENKNKTPILMLTAKSEIVDTVIGLNSGADDYLAKPFAFDELIARIKSLARRPKSLANSNLLETLNLTYKPGCSFATVDKQNISLTKREAQLLEFLLRNKDKIVSKDDIVNHVWEYDADVLPNTVEQHIKSLRKKIEKNDVKLIHTFRGFGYRIGKL